MLKDSGTLPKPIFESLVVRQKFMTVQMDFGVMDTIDVFFYCPFATVE